MQPIKLPSLPIAGNYNSIDPLDGRYYDAEGTQFLSERSQIAYYAYVEAALAHTLAEFGVCSQEIAEKIEEATRQVTAEEVYSEEQTTNHHTKALVNAIKNHLDDDAKPFVHFGATSFDIVSTGEALQLRTVTQELIIPRLRELLQTLLAMVDQYADTPQVGRTHGQHAAPITFGFAIAGHLSRLGGSMNSLQVLSSKLPGKFSGSVGGYNALGVLVDDPIAFEESLLAKLGLQPAPHSTQIVPAEYTVRLLDELTITAGIMANLSRDMRHLQRNEIAEVRERFEPGQKGLEHKRNSWSFENVISMAKQVTGQLVNANLNISSEHQHDLTDSASSRFYTITFASVASMAKRLNNVMSKLEIDEENMQRNLHLAEGAIAAEPLFLLLEKYGHPNAYEASKAIAHTAIESQQSLYDAVSTTPAIGQYWQKCTDKERQLIQRPEDTYTGLAAKKARSVYNFWHDKLL